MPTPDHLFDPSIADRATDVAKHDSGPTTYDVTLPDGHRVRYEARHRFGLTLQVTVYAFVDRGTLPIDGPHELGRHQPRTEQIRTFFEALRARESALSDASYQADRDAAHVVYNAAVAHAARSHAAGSS